MVRLSRHDYLPFGEELFGTGGRTTAMGYTATDNVRRKFTLKERDNETGLDYSVHRYYSPIQGRFTSIDPTLQSINGVNPQTLNRYTYVLNAPLNFVDPFGLWTVSYQEIWENGEYVRTEVRIAKSKKDDDAASLLKQLGFDAQSKEGQKLLAQITDQLKGGEEVDPEALAGSVGRTFKAFEEGISRQVAYDRKNGYKQNLDPQGPDQGFNEEYADCSMTATRIAMPNQMRDIRGLYAFGVQQADDKLAILSSPSDGLRVGDVVRYGTGQKRHFANILFKDDDGITQIFSRSGTSGRFENLRVDDKKLTEGYGRMNKTFRVPFGP